MPQPTASCGLGSIKPSIGSFAFACTRLGCVRRAPIVIAPWDSSSLSHNGSTKDAGGITEVEEGVRRCRCRCRRAERIRLMLWILRIDDMEDDEWEEEREGGGVVFGEGEAERQWKGP